MRCEGGIASTEIFAKGLALHDLFDGRVRGRTYKKLASFRGQPFETAYPAAVKMFFGRSAYLQDALLTHFARRDRELRFTDGPLPRIALTSIPVLLNGYRAVQAAVQWSPQIATVNDPLFIQISRAFWTGPAALETDQKIALLFHEYLFGTQIAVGNICASSRVVEVLSSVLSDQAFGMDRDEWAWSINFGCQPVW